MAGKWIKKAANRKKPPKRARRPGEIPGYMEMKEEAFRVLEESKQRPVPIDSIPGANPELWPGGPSEDAGDMLIARMLRRIGKGYA